MRDQDRQVIRRNGRRKRELTLRLRLIMPGQSGRTDGPLRGRIKVRMVATFEPGMGIGLSVPVGRRVEHSVSTGDQEFGGRVEWTIDQLNAGLVEEPDLVAGQQRAFGNRQMAARRTFGDLPRENAQHLIVKPRSDE